MSLRDPEHPVNLMDYDKGMLRTWFEQQGEKPFRATQIISWIHQRGELDFDAMTDLSKPLRKWLQESTHISLPAVASSELSSDGTRKWLLELEGGPQNQPGNRIEMVFIPEETRGTLCVSSQVGCGLDCSFCATARQGFNRNLSTAEIIGQLWLARQLLAEAGVGGDAITNVVMMGMGEPLLNFRNLLPALNLMMDDHAYGLSKRRVTVSTAGIVPGIDRLREHTDVALAVSLHAANDPLRDKLVPLNRKFPLVELLAACRRYVEGYQKRRVTFEYVMLAGINDQLEHAKELATLLEGVPCKINLIPFNPFPGIGYQRSTESDALKFGDYLMKRGYVATIRKTRGNDIAAACGQLAGKVADRSHRHLRFVEQRFGTTVS
ncbi:MAG: 23S rRNA (adenine(2503)-C(2))-methyltransferase RlmN [Gammaproteobacteria bacterium]|nr:23S rRNA (adenine(2503)-C(2))-methyltransferase RlmN [Gammaproteobacteria bacterium]